MRLAVLCSHRMQAWCTKFARIVHGAHIQKHQKQFHLWLSEKHFLIVFLIYCATVGAGDETLIVYVNDAKEVST